MSAPEVDRLTRQLASLAREIARLLLRTRYDEAELAELEAHANELRARIRAAHRLEPAADVAELRPAGNGSRLLPGG